MIRRGLYLPWKISGRKISFFLSFIIFFLTPSPSFGFDNNLRKVSSLTVLSHTYYLFLIVFCVTILICSVVIYITLKLRKVNRQLQGKNLEILKINEYLQNANRELSEQKENIWKIYNDSESFYSMLVRSADDGISFYDKSWNLKYANSAFYSMIGVDAENYHSGNPSELIHPEDRDYHVRGVASLLKNNVFESELRLRHSDGHYINLLARSVMVRDDKEEILGYLTISRDITKMKQVYEELQKAKIAAEASDRLKSSFLANISHEIRTPLNSVMGFSNLFLSDDVTKEVREEYVEHINYNSEKLLQIIGDIIDLSRLESSQIEISYEEYSINSIIDETVAEAKKIIKLSDKKVLLNINNEFTDKGDLVFTDRNWLKRVINHLMDNAFKFTPEGSIDYICALEDDQIVIKIKDTGVGIDKENLDKIFEEFRQEFDGYDRPFEGLGVGLTLAKEVIERMGGRIFVKSEKGIGSEFGFSIPYRPAGSSFIKKAIIPEERHLTNVNWSSKKCLLIDDNTDTLVYIKKILDRTGIAINTASTGTEALEFVKFNEDLDLVLIDMQVPEMDGIEITREIRKAKSKLPIIVHTASVIDDEDSIPEADACLIKPVRSERLLKVMAGLLK